MQPLQGQNVLLGVTGGIASYKSAYLARRLIEAGAEVRVVMTEGARAFVAPLTFQALTGNPVHTDLLDPSAEAAMGHIELARWGDHVLIAPASANTLARLAHGFADDLLGTLCLASDAPLYAAPAMNQQMWAHAATQANCATLAERGCTLFGPAEGEQACGDVGAGRMLEPDDLCQALIDAVGARAAGKNGASELSLAGRRIVITAGPTREPIDPVRYISNHSSGKMGYALASVAAARGADVTLVSGPTALHAPVGVTRIDVQSAAEMHEAVMQATPDADIFIGVAAVSDYRVAEANSQKIKKSGDSLTLSLVQNADILADVAAGDSRPFCVGFAAETQQVEQHARAKLARKRLDLIAANHVGQTDNPVFGSDRNQLEVYWGDEGHRSIASASKIEVAATLLAIVADRLAQQTPPARSHSASA